MGSRTGARLTACIIAVACLVALTALPGRAATSQTPPVSQAKQELTAAKSHLSVTRQRVSQARNQLARTRQHLLDARSHLAETVKQGVAAHRATLVATADARQATITQEQTDQVAAETRAAVLRLARNAYMNGSTTSDLALMVGFASDGPATLSDLAHQDIAVDRLQARSFTDAQQAADRAAAAMAASERAFAAYESAVSHEREAVAAQTRARTDLTDAAQASRDAAAGYRGARTGAARAMKRYRAAQAAYKRSVHLACVHARAAGAQTPASAPPISAGSSAQLVWNTLISEGFTEQAAAGVLGNLQQESNIDPTSMQFGGPGMGIAQWSRGGRWDTGSNSLLAYAAANGLDPWDARTQTQFMITEMSSAWGGFDIAMFKHMTDVVAATVYFHDVFERSADSHDFVVTVRGGYALQWYARLQGTKATHVKRASRSAAAKVPGTTQTEVPGCPSA
jgi:Phage tail lysozyme